MKWKRTGYPTDGSTFEVIVKSSKGNRKTLAYIHENYDRTALLIKSIGGQYWRSFSESLVAWRPIEEIEVGTIEELKEDLARIEKIILHFSNYSQVFDNGFGEMVNEVGTYDALHAIRISSRAVRTEISPTVGNIFSKYETIIEGRKYGLIQLQEYVKEMIGDL